MCKKKIIEQKQSIGSTGTQIGVQNNYGPSFEEITRLVTQLFIDNFPRMQLLAKETAEARVNELWNEIVSKTTANGIANWTPLLDIDVQYCLYEAQKSYARFGTSDLLEKLSSLVAKRISHNDDDMCLKVTIDQAISIIGMISPAQLDYLSLLFLTTKVKFDKISTLAELKRHFESLDKSFPKARLSNWQHLNMLKCLQMEIPDVCKIASKTYGFTVQDINNICPENIKMLTGDYTTSPIGIILAIIHAEQKTAYRFDPKIWIHN